MSRMFTATFLPRVAIAAGQVAALVLLAAVPAQAAKNPDKPDKPERPEKIDRTEKPDKFERAKKMERRERAESLASAELIEPAGRRDRADKNGRASRIESSARSDRAPSAGAATGATAPPDAKFDSFRIILERNIFNPNRVGRTRPEDEVKPPRDDVIALVGTMQSEKGVVAFFDSTDPAFRKTLREGESVGGFKVERIAPDSVDLSAGDKPVSLRVAQELRRPEGGEWKVSTTERRSESSTSTLAARGSATPAQPAAPPPIPPGASDALRRLMEQRQKQLKQ